MVADGGNVTDLVDFTNYVESTVAPGWTFTIVLTILFIVLHCSLPCLVTIGKRCERMRNSKRNNKSASSSPTDHDDDDENNHQHHLEEDGASDQNHDVPLGVIESRSEFSVASSHISNVSNNFQHQGNLMRRGKRSRNATPKIHPRRLNPEMQDGASAISHSSMSSAVSSAVSTVVSAVLEARPNGRTGRQRRHRARDPHRNHSSQQPNQTSHSNNDNSHANQNGLNAKNLHSNMSTEGSQECDGAGKQLPKPARSVPTSSHEDNVSEMGDPPAKPSCHGTTIQLSKQQHGDDNDDNNNGPVDLLYGENAWWKAATIRRGFYAVVEIVEWDKEMSKLYHLALPFTIQAFLEGFFHVLGIALIGHLIGIREANAFICVTLLNELTNTVNYGFYEALGTLGPQAEGASNYKRVGKTFQLSLIFYTIGAIPVIILWLVFTKDAILWFGFDEPTAVIGESYVRLYLFIELVDGIDACLHQLLDFTGHEYYSTLVKTLEQALLPLSIVIMKYSGYVDLVRIGMMHLALRILAAGINYIFVIQRGWLDPYWGGLVQSCALFERKPVMNMLRTALPLSVSWVLTYAEWEILTIFASFMGPAEVAAFGILGNVWATFEYLTEGIADATELRVAYHMGNGRPDRAKSVAFKAIAVSVFVSITLTSILYILGIDLVRWVTPDPTLQRMIFELIPLVGVGQVGLTSGVTFLSVIGAQGRYELTTGIEIIASWLIVIPLSAIFVLVCNLNLQGLVAALVIGYGLSGTANAYIVLRSDWVHLSQIVVERSEDDDDDDSSSSGSDDSDDSTNSNSELQNTKSNESTGSSAGERCSTIAA